MTTATKVQLVCNECGKKRLVSANGNYNERCPKCGGVDWDLVGFESVLKAEAAFKAKQAEQEIA